MPRKLFHIYRDRILIARVYSQAARDAVIRLLEV